MIAHLIDYAVLRELAGVTGDSGSGFMLEITDGFAADARLALERMRACARAGDAPRLAREAHRLKGSSGTMGARGLAFACFDMERAARAGSCQGIEDRVDSALRVLEASHGHIAEFFRGNIAARV